MKAQCSFIKPNGERCKLPVMDRQNVCWAHAPENARKRSNVAAMGGRAKGHRELTTIKETINRIIRDVEGENLDRNNASVMLAGFRVLKEYLELERRLYETDHLAIEIEDLKREVQGEHKTLG